jgi:hypothetical protein
MPFKKSAPAIETNPNRNEKRMARHVRKFKKQAAVTQMPKRLTPGKRAKACAQPIQKAFNPIGHESFWNVPLRFDMPSNKPKKAQLTAIQKGERAA